MPVKERPQPRTLVDCGCRTHVYGDGSGVELYHCALHGAAEDLLKVAKFAHSVIAANGVWESSERLAIEKLSAAIKKAEGQS